VVAFEPNGGAGTVGQWVDFLAAYGDCNGYSDIPWAFFSLARQLPLSRAGLAAIYYKPSNALWLLGGGYCVPGAATMLTTAYLTLDCSNASVSGGTAMLPSTGTCGRSSVSPAASAGTWPMAMSRTVMGTWTLNPGAGTAGQRGAAAKATEVYVERLRKAIEAWQSQLGERYPMQR